MSHMTRKHITLWLRCIVCETCSEASMTMKLHKEVDHKNYESSTNFTSFFNRRNRPIGEKMFPIVRSTSSTRFLHPITDPPATSYTTLFHFFWTIEKLNFFCSLLMKILKQIFDMWHVIHSIWGMNIFSKFQLFSSSILGLTVYWRYLD